MQLGTNYAPNSCLQLYRRHTTVVSAMHADAPKLTALVRQFGETKIIAYIKLWLVDLNTTLDLKKPLNENQIDQIAFAIIDTYRSLNLAEINLIFTNAKYGEYGDFYDRITMPTVLKWFKNYFEQRCSCAANNSYQESIQYKSYFGNAPRNSENWKEQLQKANHYHQKRVELKETESRINTIKNQQKSNE